MKVMENKYYKVFILHIVIWMLYSSIIVVINNIYYSRKIYLNGDFGHDFTSSHITELY